MDSNLRRLAVVALLLCLPAATGSTAALVGDAPHGAVAPGDGTGAVDVSVAQTETTDAPNGTGTPPPTTPIGIGPGRIRVTDASLSESEIAIGESVEIVATVENRGDEPGEIEITAYAGTIVVGETRIRVEPNAETEVRFEYRPADPGQYLMLVNGQYAGVLTVNETDPTTYVFGVPLSVITTYTGWIGFVSGAVVLGAGGLFAVAVLLRRIVAGRTFGDALRRVEQLWMVGGALLLVGSTAGEGSLPFQGAIAGAVVLFAYGLYALAAVIYRSG